MPINAGGGSGSAGSGSSGGGFGSGGFHQDYNYGNDFNNYNNGFGRRTRRRKGSSFSTLVIVFILIVFAIVYFKADDSGSITTENEQVTVYDDEHYDAVKTQKQKLDSDLCEKTGKYLYNNAVVNIVRNTKRLNKAFEAFTDKTGIEPVLYITDEYVDDMENEAYDLYLDLFADEGHLLIYFYTDSSGYDYSFQLVIGDDAAEKIFDTDAQETLRSALENVGDSADIYDSGYDYSNAFYKMMKSVAEDVMIHTEYVPKETDENYSESGVTETDGNAAVTEEKPSSVGVSKVAMMAIIIAVAAFLLLTVIVIIAKKRNCAKPDEYHSDRTDNDYSLDDYDEQFKKRDSKYDDFLK